MPLRTVLLIAGLLAANSLPAETIDPLLDFLLTTRDRVWLADEELHHHPKPNDTSPPAGPSRPVGGFSLSTVYSDYYRQGAALKPGASFGQRRSGMAFVSGGSAADWRLALGTSTAQTRVDIQRNIHQQFIRISDNRTKIRVVRSVATRMSAASVGVELSEDEPLGMDLAGRALVHRDGGVTLRWRRSRDRPQLSGEWREESATVLLPLHYETSGLALRTATLRGVRVVASYSWTNLREHWKTSPVPAIEPTGVVGRDWGAVEFGKSSYSLWIGSRGLVTRLQARGFERVSSFAKITRFDTDIRSLFAGYEWRPRRSLPRSVRWEFERLQWEAESRGHVEFWPFTSGLADLLGLRRYFIASTEGTLWRMHLQYSRTQRNGVGWSVGGHIFDVRLSGELDHWPLFLVSGGRDFQHLELTARRIVGCIPQLEVSTGGAGFKFSYGFTQVIPVKTWRRTIPGAPAPPAPRGRRPYGGGFHSLTVGYFKG